MVLFYLRVLLRKFRVPRENPVIFQLGLVEREINEILQGYLMRQSPETDQSGASSGSHGQLGPQREVGPEDVCPICQEELLGGKSLPLTYCKFGCGKSVHIKCMRIWAEHQKSTGEKIIQCPLCRENFGSFQVSWACWTLLYRLGPKSRVAVNSSSMLCSYVFLWERLWSMYTGSYQSYTVLVYTVLVYSVLVYSVLIYTVLVYTVLVYSVLIYSVLVYSVLIYRY